MPAAPRSLVVTLLAAAVAASCPAVHAQTPPPAPANAPLSYQQPLAPDAVQRVQDKLRAQGAYAGQVNGVWGADSETALTQFQQTHGLQPTGQLNQATAVVLGLNPADLVAAAVSAPLPAPHASAPPLPPVNTPASVAAAPEPIKPPQEGAVLSIAAVRNLQSRLQVLGYYTGGIDGEWGPQAEAALTRFQRASGIDPSGRINPQTVSAMGLNPNDLSAPAAQ
jgi:peptidoglycan hydrolase-like protein with peptidoglycan-binding domain